MTSVDGALSDPAGGMRPLPPEVADVGKVVHREELSGPGSAHEPAGYELLVAHGVAPERARFARTHAVWDDVGAFPLSA
jgi:hypothetical protein